MSTSEGRPGSCQAAQLLVASVASLVAGVVPVCSAPLPFDPGPAPRLAVVAPHPDDETIAAGGLLARLAAAGHAVQVVFLSSGDGWPWALAAAWGRSAPSPADYLAFGRVRMDEARLAAQRLGLPSAALRFLGFPDAGLDSLWRERWAGAIPYRSLTTGVDAVPYSGTVRPGAPYLGHVAADMLASLLRGARPTVVVLPHPYDTHPDHAAAGRLGIHVVRRLVAERGLPRRSRLVFYLVHHPRWPYAPLPGENLQRPPRAVDVAHTVWRSVVLTPEELARKTAALEAHATQLAASPDFLRQFLRANELFGRLKSRVLAAIAATHEGGVPRASETDRLEKVRQDTFGGEALARDSCRVGACRPVIRLDGSDRCGSLRDRADSMQARPAGEHVAEGGVLRNHGAPSGQVTGGAIAEPAAAKANVEILGDGELAARCAHEASIAPGVSGHDARLDHTPAVGGESSRIAGDAVDIHRDQKARRRPTGPRWFRPCPVEGRQPSARSRPGSAWGASDSRPWGGQSAACRCSPRS